MDDGHHLHNLTFWQERVDLAASLRWTARLDMHEGVANHFSVHLGPGRFLVNPNKMHFSRVKASDLIEVDANDPNTLSRPDAPDPTAFGLHGGLHKHCAHAKVAMHVHSLGATTLACLKDPTLPPIDQNACTFFNRIAYDVGYGGLAFEDEGARCAALFDDHRKKVLVMGNHGVMVIGDTVAETFSRLYYFERAANLYINALKTGQPLAILSDDVAEKTAQELEAYPEQGDGFMKEMKAILDEEGSNYAS
ncbi:MAG: class II aldolase and adducin N-terminal domain-containing protein [Pseudomonadota bacterium]